MATTRSLTIEHDGRTYSGQLARIKSTSLGWEDHGILTAFLHCEWTGGGVGVGGFSLDQHNGERGSESQRLGTAYGLDHLMKLMQTVGVESWEKLPGQQVIVLFDAQPGTSTWGARSVGIAGVLNDKVLILNDHAEKWRQLDALAAG